MDFPSAILIQGGAQWRENTSIPIFMHTRINTCIHIRISTGR
jgi:hypothetical protein